MTAPLSAAGQYASIQPFVKTAPENLSGSPEDILRVQAYEVYEDFYHNRPETFKVMLRGEDEEQKEIYIPSAKKMIEAKNRFLGKDFEFAIPPQRGTPEEQAVLELAMENLFKREKITKKFQNQKRYGLIRGDALWHITADPNKEPGSRISVHELNPANYFRIEDPENANRILGCHIVDVVPDPRDASKTIARRLTYLRRGAVLRGGDTPGYVLEEGVDSSTLGITSETTHWAIGKWDDRYMKQSDLERVNTDGDRPLMDLPPGITSIPVYHWKNNEIPGEAFGTSELAGIETLIAGINQAVNDEDLTLVIQGLGVYATDARPPEQDGQPTTWDISPGSVVETPAGSKFERVSGVGSVQPYQDHINMLKADGMEALGIPDIAAGKVDVTVAESGVSLALQMMPIIADVSEKEEEILGTMDHLLYDIARSWLPEFEGITAGQSCAVVSIVGEPIPVNRDAKIQEVILLFTSGLITVAQAQAELAKLGYSFMHGDDKRVIQEAHQRAKAAMGELDNRFEQELENAPDQLSSNAGQNVAPMLSAGATGVPSTIGANSAAGELL